MSRYVPVDAESPKAAAGKLLHEIEGLRHGRREQCISRIAQEFRNWEARGLEAMAASLAEVPVADHLRQSLLVRAKELRGRAIDLA